MSKENDITVEVYKKKANIYLKTSIKHDNIDLDKAKCKRQELEQFIKNNIEILPKGSKILEIGSGDGTNAQYIERLGYDVTASDIVDDFIKATNSKGVKTIKLNVLKDKITEKYSAIFCWRVFVHFTKEDIENTFQRIYNILDNNGLVIFNVMNREIKKVEDEWIDFSNEYHMGAERYYRYFSKNEVDEVINKIGYQIYHFHTEGGDNNNKWLVYVLKKTT